MFPIFRDGDQAGLLGALDLAVDRRMRGADPGRDLGQAEFQIGIAEQEREDLALLLGAQDGQERRGGLSIHYLKSTLQFADSRRKRVPGLPRMMVAAEARAVRCEPDPERVRYL